MAFILLLYKLIPALSEAHLRREEVTESKTKKNHTDIFHLL